MNTQNIKKLINSKQFLTFENKKKLLKVLKEYKSSGKRVIFENEIQSKNIIAKKFNTSADFDSYVSQHRGLEILPQELQAITNYDKAEPTQLTKFYIKYESTDEFSNNNTTIIKKLKEGTQYCWTAFSKNQSSNSNSETLAEADENPPIANQPNKTQMGSQPAPKDPQQNAQDTEQPASTQTLKDTIEIIKSITFSDEINGSKILADFLIKLDI